METTQLGMNYITALSKKYEAEMAEAKANLALYVNQLVAIGEHSDLMEEHDKWIEKYTNAKIRKMIKSTGGQIIGKIYRQ